LLSVETMPSLSERLATRLLSKHKRAGERKTKYRCTTSAAQFVKSMNSIIFQVLKKDRKIWVNQ